MRRALAVLAALALAACSVNVEGAPCRVPGETTDCPSGQACGNDLTCSGRAATCARCTPGETLCATADGTVWADRCTDADSVCGSWIHTDCGSRGLVCGYSSPNSAAACECPAGFAGPEFAADPVAGSPSGAAPFPTGSASPPECRFKSLGDAISSAGQAQVSAAVRAYGTGQVVFGADASGDGPITIPANVTVIASTDATATVLRGGAAGGAALVTVQGTLDGFRIEGASGDGAAVATSCGAAGRPALTSVAIDGGGTLTAGVDVSGTCGADLTDVVVANVAGPALTTRADASAQVTVRGGGLQDSEVGAHVTGGKVTFGSDSDPAEAVEISGNVREGVVVTGGAAADVRMYDAEVHDNGGTGIVVDMADAGSAVKLRGCDVYSNGDAAARTYGPSPQRKAGGVLVAEGALPFTFFANRIYGNAGDQLVFESSDPNWSIAPAACGGSSNVFACVATGAYAVAVAGGGKVDARNTVWPAVPFQTYASAGVTGSYCNGVDGVPSTPTCPVP